jgi:DNA invertase Pin-like site-specific DNA recombinase
MTKQGPTYKQAVQRTGLEVLQAKNFDITEHKNIKAAEYEHTDECAAKGCLIAAAYIRQSKGEEDSMEAQQNAIGRWKAKAEQDTEKIVHIGYIVFDKTGAWVENGPPPKRPGYDTLRQLVSHKKIDILLARELSRYNRIPEDLLIFLRECREGGIFVSTMMDGINGDAADNQNLGTAIMVVIKAVTNSQSSRETGQRITENTIELRECGFWLGGMQEGYFPRGGEYRETMDERGRPIRELYAPRHPRTHSSGQTIYGKILDPVDGWKEAANKAAGIIISGGNLRQAGKAFQEAGFECRMQDGQIESGRIRLWLTSPILIGYQSHDTDGVLRVKRANNGLRRLQYVQRDADGVPVRGVTPVMEDDRWLELQHAIQSREDMRTPRTPFLLQGAMKCEKCGYTMTRAKSSRTGFGMYICLNTKRGTCGGVSISMDKTDEYVTQQILDRFDPAKIEASRLSWEAEKAATLGALPQGHADELKDLNSKYDIITDMLLDETSPAARTKLKARMDEIAKRIDELQAYKQHEPKASPISIILDGAEVSGRNLKDLWPTFKIETKNAIVRAATEGIQIKGVLRNQNDGKGRFTYDNTRIVIWWRGEDKPAAWDQQHISHAQLASDTNEALV